MNVDTTLYDTLLSDLAALPSSSIPPKTFLQIAGVAHQETVASNILRFYLDPSSGHGLHTLLVESVLAEAGYNLAAQPQIRSVRTEDYTGKGNRLDLVIEANSFVLGIENKLFHTVNNPFDDYSEHLESLSAGRPIYTVLLALKSVDASPALHTFRPITYRSLFERVMVGIDEYRTNAQEPYLTYLHDFVRSIRSFYEGTHMDHQMLEYFQQRRDKIEGFLGQVATLHDELRQRLTQVAELVGPIAAPYPIDNLGFYRPPAQLYALQGYLIRLPNGLSIQININLSPDGWQLNLFNGKGKRELLYDWLKVRGLDLPIRQMEPFRMIGETEPLPYQTPHIDISEHVHDLIRRLTAPLSATST